MQRFWLWIGRGADLAQLILFVVAIPTAAGLAVWWLSHVVGSGTAVVLGVISYAILQIGLIGAAVAARRQAGRTPDLDLKPTGGPSQDLRLVVTNGGRKTDFHGTAEVVATRNYQNHHRQGTYALMWLGRGTNIIALDRGQSHALVLARWKILNMGPGDRMGEVELVECNGSQEAVWDGFRWNFLPTEALPEFDIDVTVAGSGFSKPVRHNYTLRPTNWIGPLELIERTSTSPKPSPAVQGVSPRPPAAPTMIARPLGMELHPRSDVDIEIVRDHWMRIGDKQSLVVDIRIHNTSATWPRTIRRHRFDITGVQSVHGDELSVYLTGSTLSVGLVEPLQTIEGTISCQISEPLFKPAYELYIEDDLGRESKAGR